MAGEGERLGFYGFGAAAHVLAQVALWQGRKVFAFTSLGDGKGQAFARPLGCQWAGSSGEAPPDELDAAIIFAPVGALVTEALKRVRKSGRIVCAGIHERHTRISLCRPVGRALDLFCRQSHPRRRHRIPGSRGKGARADADDSVSAGAGERGAGCFARRADQGRSRARPVRDIAYARRSAPPVNLFPFRRRPT